MKLQKLLHLKKTVIGSLAPNEVQRTIISFFGIHILERRRILLGSMPISSISGGGVPPNYKA